VFRKAVFRMAKFRKTMRVLVTRPAEDNARTAAALEALGHVAVLAPLFSVVPLPASLEGPHDAVIATSANAVRCADATALSGLAHLPFHAVGAATADAARQAGFVDITSAGGDSHDLARHLAEMLPAGTRILQLAGRPRRDDAIAALGGRFHLAVAETYETRAVDALPLSIRNRLAEGEVDAVLHFSPRAARIFADLAEAAGLLPLLGRLVHVFISASAVDSRLPAGRIAASPDLESVVASL
jgi:uroporphyrinogen-III synthase